MKKIYNFKKGEKKKEIRGPPGLHSKICFKKKKKDNLFLVLYISEGSVASLPTFIYIL